MATDRITVLRADEARALWPRLAPAVERALSRNGAADALLRQELEDAVLAGKAQVLMGPDGFGVVYIAGGVCNLIAYVGSLREIRALAPEFLTWVRAAGCHKVRIIGSRTWLRAFPGLTERAIVAELFLDS